MIDVEDELDDIDHLVDGILRGSPVEAAATQAPSVTVNQVGATTANEAYAVPMATVARHGEHATLNRRDAGDVSLPDHTSATQDRSFTGRRGRSDASSGKNVLPTRARCESAVQQQQREEEALLDEMVQCILREKGSAGGGGNYRCTDTHQTGSRRDSRSSSNSSYSSRSSSSGGKRVIQEESQRDGFLANDAPRVARHAVVQNNEKGLSVAAAGWSLARSTPSHITPRSNVRLAHSTPPRPPKPGPMYKSRPGNGSNDDVAQRDGYDVAPAPSTPVPQAPTGNYDVVSPLRARLQTPREVRKMMLRRFALWQERKEGKQIQAMYDAVRSEQADCPFKPYTTPDRFADELWLGKSVAATARARKTKMHMGRVHESLHAYRPVSCSSAAHGRRMRPKSAASLSSSRSRSSDGSKRGTPVALMAPRNLYKSSTNDNKARGFDEFVARMNDARARRARKQREAEAEDRRYCDPATFHRGVTIPEPFHLHDLRAPSRQVVHHDASANLLAEPAEKSLHDTYYSLATRIRKSLLFSQEMDDQLRQATGRVRNL